MHSAFVVIDTEGREHLTELAIIGDKGQLLYQAISSFHPHYETEGLGREPLAQILTALLHHGKDQALVCHYAEHDAELIQRSFQQEKIDYPDFEFICTWKLAKQHWQSLADYSLAYLCQYFERQHQGHYFVVDKAHNAVYDAQFTYQLYRYIRKQMIKPTANPYASSRVDTPFQHHLDLSQIHQGAFASLASIIDEIKTDPNQQSRGAVVLGEAGSGKTHLMMRLAQQKMQHHRLLFIRQPNHPQHVLYHIYSRVLESFIEKIPDTDYSQLEYLLGQSFAKMLLTRWQQKLELNQAEQRLQISLGEDPLNIYQLVNQVSPSKRRNFWTVIEKQTLNSWQKKYGFSGYASAVIKGLIKYCYYVEPVRRAQVQRWLAGDQLEAEELKRIGLENWESDLTREEFALSALEVFGKLSIIDEPLIIIFDQLEGLKYNQHLLTQFGEAVKEIFTHVPNSLVIFNLFPDRWHYLQQFFDASITDRMGQYQLQLQTPEPSVLERMLKLKAQEVGCDVADIFTPEDLNDILAQTTIRKILNRAADYYRYRLENLPLPELERQKIDQDRIQIQLNAINQALNRIQVHLNIPGSHDISSQTLSTDKNLTQYLSIQAEKLAAGYQQSMIISDSDDSGKLHTILTALQTLFSFDMEVLRLGKRRLPEHVSLVYPQKQVVIGFLHVTPSSFVPRLKNFNELVISHKQKRFVLFRDQREALIRGRVGKIEIEKLKNSDNGQFLYMDKANRLSLELIYQAIIDLQNHDLDTELAQLYVALQDYIGSDYWLFRALPQHKAS